MLFFHRYLRDLNSVKNEVDRVIAKQKLGSHYDLSPFKATIDELLDSISDFNLDWNKLPVVFRIAKIVKGSTTEQHDLNANNARNGAVIVYQENVVLPDAKHDLELIIKMLNYIREQKKLKKTKIPLFIHPDELLLAHKEGKISSPACHIQTQMTIVFQKGSVTHIGFVFGRKYVILNN